MLYVSCETWLVSWRGKDILILNSIWLDKKCQLWLGTLELVITYYYNRKVESFCSEWKRIILFMVTFYLQQQSSWTWYYNISNYNLKKIW